MSIIRGVKYRFGQWEKGLVSGPLGNTAVVTVKVRADNRALRLHLFGFICSVKGQHFLKAGSQTVFKQNKTTTTCGVFAHS